MANRLPILAVVAAVILFLIYSSVFVVNARQQALVLRFGEIVDVKNEPGIYFKAPFAFFDADSVQLIENRVLRFDLDNIRVQVSGGKFYEVDAFIAYRISDPRVFRAAVSGQIGLAEARLRTRLDAALRRVYGLRDFEAALSEERAVMMREVRDQLRPDATSLGLQIEDVRIRRTDLTAEEPEGERAPPVGGERGVDLAAHGVEAPLQHPGPLHQHPEVGRRAVHRDGVRVHGAEPGHAGVALGHRRLPQVERALQQVVHGASLAEHRGAGEEQPASRGTEGGRRGPRS